MAKHQNLISTIVRTKLCCTENDSIHHTRTALTQQPLCNHRLMWCFGLNKVRPSISGRHATLNDFAAFVTSYSHTRLVKSPQKTFEKRRQNFEVIVQTLCGSIERDHTDLSLPWTYHKNWIPGFQYSGIVIFFS